MEKILSILIGLGILGYFAYVIVLVFQIFFGMTDASWASISGHLTFTGVLILIILLGQLLGEKEAETKEPKKTQKDSTDENPSQDQHTYNPYVDKLDFTVYRQEFKTWWYDNDGDKHEHSTIHASLRFYEDGTVIGIRSDIFPKMDVADSFTMKGNWTLAKNQLDFTLEKVSDVDDSIEIYISPEENREMKYYGQIADDNSLIKAGTYKGEIRAGHLYIKNHIFSKLPIEKLIITASESTCDKLESTIKDHPYVLYTFQNTGNWYSNGETGPEWFTVHIATSSERQKEVDHLINKKILTQGLAVSNMFWS